MTPLEIMDLIGYKTCLVYLQKWNIFSLFKNILQKTEKSVLKSICTTSKTELRTEISWLEHTILYHSKMRSLWLFITNQVTQCLGSLTFGFVSATTTNYVSNIQDKRSSIAYNCTGPQLSASRKSNCICKESKSLD